MSKKKKPDYAILSSKMRSTLLALEILERTAVSKDTKKEERIPQGAIEVITVEKSQPYTALKRVESIFQNTQVYVKIMDKWIGKRTLDFVMEVPSTVPVMILTGFVEKKSQRKFSSLYERIRKEKGGKIDIRICDPSEFHDRYIITNNELWQSGPSLKDLGITKWGTISKIGNASVKMDIEGRFDNLWKSSTEINLN